MAHERQRLKTPAASTRSTVRALFVAMVIAASLVIGVPMASAHTTVEVDPYEIEVGWGIEPPIEGMRNTVVYSVTESGGSEGVRRGVAASFSGIEVTLKFGGVERAAEILNDPKPGHYYTKIIPTRAGSYSVHLEGNIGETPVDTPIRIEDVERTAALDFPPREASGNADIDALRSTVSAMQREIASGGAAAPTSDPVAYDIALFGAAFGVAGIALATMALIKRR